MAALDGAVALAEVDDVAVRVGEDLHLDVAAGGDRPLEDEVAVAEGALGLAAGRLGRALEGVVLLDEAHAAPAAAGRGLDHHREADLVGLLEERGDVLLRALPAGDDRHFVLRGELAGLGLVAHQAHGVGGRADEGDAGCRAGLGEGGVLRE